MVKNILVCLDGSAVSKCAWDQAVSDILQAGDHVEFLAVHEPIVHTMPLEGLYEMGAKANDAARNALHEAIKPYKVLAEEKVRVKNEAQNQESLSHVYTTTFQE